MPGSANAYQGPSPIPLGTPKRSPLGRTNQRGPDYDLGESPLRGTQVVFECTHIAVRAFVVAEPNFLNRTLWIGDNLPVLRGINSECVDLVCLDPPFNSKRLYNAPLGSDAAGAQFDDTWTMDGAKEEWTELQEASDPGLYHTVIGASLSSGEAM